MYIFIVNPHSRSGLGQTIWNELELILNKRQISYQVFFTKYQKHTTELASQFTSDGQEHIIVALGGDGTINETINGIRDYKRTILGYIPTGSGNDFARGHNLPVDPVKALDNILSCSHIKTINVGTLQYQDKSRSFAVSAGMGFDAAVCHEMAVSRLKRFLNKLKLGKLSYTAVALHRLFLAEPQEVRITFNHQETLTFPSTYFVSIMNSKYEGGGLKLCPKAEVDDGKLDVIVISNISKLKILALLPIAFWGMHTNIKGVHIYTCRHIAVHTKKPLPVHTDGEPIFLQRNISAACKPEKLRIIISK